MTSQGLQRSQQHKSWKTKNFTASAAPLAGGNGTGQSVIERLHTLVFMDNGEKQKEAL